MARRLAEASESLRGEDVQDSAGHHAGSGRQPYDRAARIDRNISYPTAAGKGARPPIESSELGTKLATSVPL